MIAHLPLNLILNDSLDCPSFSTIKAILPAGVKKATLYKLPAIDVPTRTDPDGTNLEACAII